MRDDYLEKLLVESVTRAGLMKERRYIDDPSEAPEGVDVQQGERGGYYYETDGSSSGGGGESNDSGGTEGSGGRDEGESFADVSVDEARELVEREDSDVCQAGLALGNAFGESRTEKDAIWHQVQEIPMEWVQDGRWELRPEYKDEAVKWMAEQVAEVVAADEDELPSMLPDDHPEAR